MKKLQTKCEKLKNKNRNLKQEVVNLKSRMPVNMTEFGAVEQSRQQAKERARRDVEGKSVSRFSQVSSLIFNLL